MQFKFKYAGLIDYDSMHKKMLEKIPEAVQQKTVYFWGLEHPLVYTSGLNFRPEHIVNDISVKKVRRGGSVTLHNRGQLVFYTVFPLELLEGSGPDLLIRIFETAITEILLEAGITAYLTPPHSGVWTPQGKIAFTGLGMKQKAVFHGISVNLTNNLDDYRPIFSCGLKLPVTSLAELTDNNSRVEENDLLDPAVFAGRLNNSLQRRFIPTDQNRFREYINAILDKPAPRLLPFIWWQIYFNNRSYWEAHESVEMVWHRLKPGEFRILLHGLVQYASAFYKLYNKPNAKGAVSLFEKALTKLKYNSLLHDYIAGAEELISFAQNTVSRLKDSPDIEESEIRNEIYRPLIISLQKDQRITRTPYEY